MKPKVKLKIKPLRKKGRYIFTDNKHPQKFIFSSALGVISAVTIYMAVRFTFEAGGQARPQYAAAVILAMVYAIAGLALGIISRTEKDIFRFFPDLGILINAIVLGCIVGILYLGLI